MTPTFEEFSAYARQRLIGEKDNPDLYTEFIKAKFDAWSIAGWKKEVKGKLVPIKIWQTTLIQALIHRQPNKVKDTTVRASVVKPKRLKPMEVPNDKYTALENLKMAYKEFEYLEKQALGDSYASVFDRLIEWKVIPNEGENKKWDRFYANRLNMASAKVHAELIDKRKFLERAKKLTPEKEKEINNQRAAINQYGYKHPKIQTRFKILVLVDYFKGHSIEEILNKTK